MSFLSGLVALAVAICTWGLGMISMTEGAMHGIDAVLSWAAVGSPVVFYSARKFKQALDEEKVSWALWIAALAPVLSVINVLIAMGAGAILLPILGKNASLRVGLIIAAVMWLAPMFRAARPHAEAGSSATAVDSTDRREA